ncbi:MAG: EutN/CcmL family microcompartment protein [Proteobacteria bacterium]|jgi:microcompartment protein CcmK/EutM|nr:EutN/CcmL family microcompartment protein [Pseudomonadota bacterium]
MLLGQVKGTVVSTRKDSNIDGFKFLLLQEVDPETMEKGGYVVAVDAVGAGVEEFVLFACGSAARQTVMTKDRPCDAVVMAIVDTWEVDGNPQYTKVNPEQGFGDL